MEKLYKGQKLNYCGVNTSGLCSCAKVATRQVKMCPKGEDLNAVHLKTKMDYRCEEHANKGTVGYKVFESLPFDQSYSIQKVNEFLRSLVGKVIHSKAHTAKGLEVKYLKENGGVMCFQPITKKYKFVYYNQITNIV